MGHVDLGRRLAVELPVDKSIEEVVLATKMVSSPWHESQTAINSAQEQAKGLYYGVVARPISPASCVSHLPLESYAREVSKRIAERPRSRVRRPRTQHGKSTVTTLEHSRDQPRSVLRPCTGAPMLSTPQASFSLARDARRRRPSVGTASATLNTETTGSAIALIPGELPS